MSVKDWLGKKVRVLLEGHTVHQGRCVAVNVNRSGKPIFLKVFDPSTTGGDADIDSAQYYPVDSIMMTCQLFSK